MYVYVVCIPVGSLFESTRRTCVDFRRRGPSVERIRCSLRLKVWEPYRTSNRFSGRLIEDGLGTTDMISRARITVWSGRQRFNPLPPSTRRLLFHSGGPTSLSPSPLWFVQQLPVFPVGISMNHHSKFSGVFALIVPLVLSTSRRTTLVLRGGRFAEARQNPIDVNSISSLACSAYFPTNLKSIVLPPTHRTYTTIEVCRQNDPPFAHEIESYGSFGQF
ncbi:hypothetical protein QCA50_007092 [Cerrena zonata]|uniref:Uncharacterized protein n=1 Tax=Cerrena zonata TaxID=2478898 RepID=A0AAW0G7K2_9APHY